MLTIRREQVDGFKPKALRLFEDDMVAHLKEFAPEPSKILGEPGVREAIRFGIKAARNYGFVCRGPVRFYIELMFMFGGYFDTDPQCRWATRILNDRETSDQMVRAERLFDQMNHYLDVVCGVRRKFLIDATKHFGETKLEDFVSPGTSLPRSVLAKLHQIYPEKCEYLGDSALGVVLQTGFQAARDFRFVGDLAQAACAIFAFNFGHRFPADPVCRWIGTDLAKESRSDPDAAINELYSKSTTYLGSMLK